MATDKGYCRRFIQRIATIGCLLTVTFIVHPGAAYSQSGTSLILQGIVPQRMGIKAVNSMSMQARTIDSGSMVIDVFYFVAECNVQCGFAIRIISGWKDAVRESGENQDDEFPFLISYGVPSFEEVVDFEDGDALVEMFPKELSGNGAPRNLLFSRKPVGEASGDTGTSATLIVAIEAK